MTKAVKYNRDLRSISLTCEVSEQRLREDPQTYSIPVVMINSDATPNQIELLRAAGASDYLTKPLSVRKLLRVIEQTLN